MQNEDGQINESGTIPPKDTGYIWAWIPTTNEPVSGYTMVTNLVKKNYKVVLDFADYTYFDIRYTPLFNEPGLYWSTDYSNTYKVFSVSNAIHKLNANYIPREYQDNILGVEGALWTELVPSNEHLWYMLLPKMVALSEVAWATPNNLNWRSFTKVLGYNNNGFLGYLNTTYDVHYRGYPNGVSSEVPNYVYK